jgi:type VI secretion system secreted protein Hcp
MSDDMFIKISGIEGESQDEQHKNEIDVTSWDWFIKKRF